MGERRTRGGDEGKGGQRGNREGRAKGEVGVNSALVVGG